MLFIQNWGKLGVKLKFKQNKRVCDSLQTLDFQLVELRGACSVIKMSGGHFLPASIRYC